MRRRWLRRLLTVPAVVIASLLCLALSPLLLLIAIPVGFVRRRRFAGVRVLGMACGYALMELAGLVGLAAVWIASGFGARRRALQRRAYGVQGWWCSGLWSVTRRMLGLRLVVEPAQAELERAIAGPVIVMPRHVSLLDVLLPAVLVLRAGTPLRWVLKRELLAEPCLDIAGHWMPNHFVDRSGARSQAELDAIEALAATMPRGHGLLIYPEGTRFTAARRRKVLARLESDDPAKHARASALEHVLPPRTGGALAAMRGAPEADVLVLEHSGLEGARSWADLMTGDLVGREIRVRVRRCRPPADPNAQFDWLWDTWGDVDRWVGDALKGARPRS